VLRNGQLLYQKVTVSLSKALNVNEKPVQRITIILLHEHFHDA
jgi:hypothetical protein